MQDFFHQPCIIPAKIWPMNPGHPLPILRSTRKLRTVADGITGVWKEMPRILQVKWYIETYHLQKREKLHVFSIEIMKLLHVLAKMISELDLPIISSLEPKTIMTHWCKLTQQKTNACVSKQFLSNSPLEFGQWRLIKISGSNDVINLVFTV